MIDDFMVGLVTWGVWMCAIQLYQIRVAIERQESLSPIASTKDAAPPPEGTP